MTLDKRCMYAAFGEAVQKEGRFIIHRNLKSCADAFEDAKSHGLSFAILFADASYDSSTLVSWSIVSNIHFDGNQTTVEFNPATPLANPVAVSKLKKVSDNKAISDSIRRGQILCNAPSFLERIISDKLQSVKPKVLEGSASIPASGKATNGGGFGSAIENKMVETAAMQFVSEWYRTKGWKVTDVSSECLGYDLHCAKGRQMAHVEVKGSSGVDRKFIITANEMRTWKTDPVFILSLVTNVNNKPEMHQFIGAQAMNSLQFTALSYMAVTVR